MINTDRVAKILDREGLDGIIASSPFNVHYCSGLWDPNFVWFHQTADHVVASRKDLSQSILITGQGDLDRTSDLKKVSDTVGVGSFARFYSGEIELTPPEELFKSRALDWDGERNRTDALCKAIQMAGLSGRVGLDEAWFGVDAKELSVRLPDIEFIPASKLFAEIRMVKTPEEVEKLRASVAVTEQSLMEGVRQAREGTSEWELWRNIRLAMTSRGAIPTFTQAKFGRHGGFEQLPRKDVFLKKGDTIWVDLGCILDGYHSDIARTFSFGQPTARVQKIYDALLTGETAALEYIRPGVTAQDVFNKTIEAVQEAGMPEYYKHHVGHGVGLEVYDRPILNANDETVLEAGMVMDIEPPYYEIGLGAFHVEDTFVITEDGTELLTTIDRSLQVLDT